MRNKISLISIFLFSLILISNVQANYNVNYYESQTTAVSGNKNIPTFAVNGDFDCSAIMFVAGNLTGATRSEVTYQYPNATDYAISEQEFVDDVGCFPFGQTTEIVNNTIESRFVTVDDASSVNYNLRLTSTCNYDNVIEFDFGQDSRGYASNLYYQQEREVAAAPTLTSITSSRMISLNGAVFGDCEDVSEISNNIDPFRNLTDIETGANKIYRNQYWYFVFNSTNGDFTAKIDFDKIHGNATNPHLYEWIQIFELDDTTAIQTICGGSTGTCTDQYSIDEDSVSLAKNTMYVMTVAVHSRLTLINQHIYVDNPLYNSTISAYTPDYVCGAYSECVNALQTRHCVDSGGISPEKIESRSCYSGVFDIQRIGFEESEESSILECKKNFVTCVSTPENISIEIPPSDQWNVSIPTVNNSGVISYSRRLVEISGERASHGFKSLKMIFNPPKIDQVIQFVSGATKTAICGNLTGVNQTSGSIPYVSTDKNTSIFVDMDLNTPFAILQLDAAVGNNSVEQYDISEIPLHNPFCVPATLCYGNCSGGVKGDMRVLISEIGDDGKVSRLLIDQRDVLVNEFNTFYYDMTPYDINVSRTYRFGIANDPPDRYDPVANVIFVDNVQLIQLEGGNLTEYLEKEKGYPKGLCNTALRCNGTTGFLMTNVGNDSCVVREYPNYLLCALSQSESDRSAINNTVGGDYGAQLAETLEDSGYGFIVPFISQSALAFIGIILGAGGFVVWVGSKTEASGQSLGLIFFIIVLGLFGFIALTTTIFGLIFPVIFILLATFVGIWFVKHAFGGGG